MDAPGVKRDADGKPIASAETITVVDLPTAAETSWANVTVRGVGPKPFELRPEVKIVAGRMFRPAVHELIVGTKAMHAVSSRSRWARSIKFTGGAVENRRRVRERRRLGTSPRSSAMRRR